MSDPLDVECGDRVRFSRSAGAVIRDIGTVVAINDHVIYGEEGEICIRAVSGGRYHVPREAVVKVLGEADGTCATPGCPIPVPPDKRYCGRCEGALERELRYVDENGGEIL